ncbi:hypothetical protein SAMN04489714_2067 [Schaalia radingae]|uniref:Uncharacterized protein n=2 Tax=Schaalia radingae TaxID=131110 RepID=A0ABY0VCH9_9ACTO|nr:hypothetical protein SAMN04489714_2067 [Schaalia radingae]
MKSNPELCRLYDMRNRLQRTLTDVRTACAELRAFDYQEYCQIVKVYGYALASVAAIADLITARIDQHIELIREAEAGKGK